tara:strand:- start:1596 stop:1886 length:291 start_codon:yes stop_codon:yes gene_type:complete
LYTGYQNELNLCPKAKVFIDFHGGLVAKHTADKHFDFIMFVNFLSTTKQLKWKEVFLKIWSLIQTFKCVSCGKNFSGEEYNNCYYHLGEPTFPDLS